MLFVFQCYPVCNFGKLVNFGLGGWCEVLKPAAFLMQTTASSKQHTVSQRKTSGCKHAVDVRETGVKLFHASKTFSKHFSGTDASRARIDKESIQMFFCFSQPL